MKKFTIAFINNVALYGVILGYADTLEEAKQLRKASGDVVLHTDTETLVRDEPNGPMSGGGWCAWLVRRQSRCAAY